MFLKNHSVPKSASDTNKFMNKKTKQQSLR